MSRGRFIVLEGIDGAGTTTQRDLLAHWLREQGREVLTTFEPTDRTIGSLIREALKGRMAERPDAATLALLFAGDRLDHLAHEIEPALAAGHDVVCDRYVASSLAYQTETVPLEWVLSLNSRALVPDLTILLRVDPELALERIGVRQGGQRDLFEDLVTLRGVAQRYERLIDDGQIVASVVDGSLDVDAVSAVIQELVAALSG